MSKLINGMSYAEWENSAEAIKKYAIRHNKYRDVFRFPDGTLIYMDTEFPTFLGEIKSVVYIGWLAPRTEENIELVKRYGGVAELAPYSLEDNIEFCFYGNGAMARAWDFVADNRERFILSNKKKGGSND